MAELRTERLVLRQWRPADRAPFAALNADPEVMAYFPAALTRKQSDALVDAVEAHIEREGWGLWALEVRDTGAFAGFTGLARPRFDAHFTPAVEVGWRLARAAWGHGYATEAARAAAAFGFDALELSEIVSFTAAGNRRSRAVMERLGMTHDPADDFDHPALPEGHPLRRHVLYRLTR
jgi:ribosomal-protein-alanine N-acetyltransferase